MMTGPAVRQRDSFLVTGATGHTGARVTAGLRALGHHARAASRRPDPRDHDAVRFDWADTGSFPSALDGVSAIYLVAPIGVAHPAPLVQPFLDLALTGGVRRVVLLSSSAVDRGEPAPLGELHELIAEQFPQYTILRPSWFMQNFVGDFPLAEGIRRGREVITATGAGRVGFIDVADIAAVGVQALTAAEPIAEELELTGPQALSYPEVADMLSDLLGEPVKHVDLTTDELTTRLTAAGLGLDFAAGLAGLDARIRAGQQDRVTTTVTDVTGRQPTSLRQFLSERLDLLR